jgi:hypothetical protein
MPSLFVFRPALRRAKPRKASFQSVTAKTE